MGTYTLHRAAISIHSDIFGGNYLIRQDGTTADLEELALAEGVDPHTLLATLERAVRDGEVGHWLTDDPREALSKAYEARYEHRAIHTSVCI